MCKSCFSARGPVEFLTVTLALRLPATHSLTLFLSALFLLASFHRSGASMGSTLQMQLGNPSGATTDPTNHSHYLILRTVEAIDYDDDLGEPNWASWDLPADDIGSSGRTDAWAADTSLPPSF